MNINPHTHPDALARLTAAVQRGLDKVVSIRVLPPIAIMMNGEVISVCHSTEPVQVTLATDGSFMWRLGRVEVEILPEFDGFTLGDVRSLIKRVVQLEVEAEARAILGHREAPKE